MESSKKNGAAPAAAPKLNFIRDVAADVDFFGSHERVAEAIAGVIANNGDLKVIGLLGRWGSGKSTVVKHVQKRLNATDGEDGLKTHVFCYDAWLHQSDPPRRSFLETFVAFLVSEGLTTQERWQLQLDILNRQVEDTETKSTPALTPSGIWLLLSLALVPLGMQFIGNPWYVGASKPGAGWFAQHAFVIGWSLLTVPVILAGLIAWFGNHEKGALLSLFVNRQVHKQVNRVTRRPDPTTIEFQKIFRAIIAGLPKGKRLIFVIDNLDRLHETEAVAMWNTIRSFFLGREHGDRTLRSASLPTVVLPIDQDAVERIYSKDHGKELGKKLARSFLDKTFDLSFHVTPPVLSDWNLYLASQLKHVFGDLAEDAWAYQVGRLYEARSRGGDEITPRGINVTINEIATLWLQWRSQVPFVTIAYFVIFRERVESDIFAAVNSPVVHIADLDSEWQRGLATLHYGAPLDKAIQVLIEPKLRRAIDNWDEEDFNDVARLPGFQETFQRILDGARPITPRFVAQVAHLLTELNPEAAPWVDAAWSTVRDIFINGQPFDTLDDWDVDGLKAMLANCPRALLPSFLRGVSARMNTHLDQIYSDDEDARVAFVNMVAALVGAAKENDLAPPKVTHAGGAETYLATIQHTSDKPDVARAISYPGEDQQLIDTLASQFSGSISSTVEPKFMALQHRDMKVNWGPAIEAAKKYLAEHPANQAATPGAAAILGQFWKESDKAKKAVKDLAEDGTLNTRIAESYHPNRHVHMARLTALAILADSSLDNPGGNDWGSVIKAVPNFAEMTRKNLEAYGQKTVLNHLVAVAQNSPHAGPLCLAIRSKKVELRSLGPLFIGQVIDQLPQYLAGMDSKLQRSFIVQLAGYESFWDELAERGFNDNVRQILRVISTSDSASSTNQKTARKALKTRLQAQAAGTWKNAIVSGAEPFPVAQALAAVIKQPLNAGTNLFDALMALLPSLVVDQPPEWKQRWFEAARLLSPASRKALHRNLRDRFFGGVSPTGLATLLQSAGEAFYEDADFAHQGDGVMRHIITPLIVSDEGLRWLSSNSELVKAWIGAAPEDARAFLKEQVQHRASEMDDVMRKRLKSAAAGWAL